MEQELEIQNLKCGGCATTISTELMKIEGISNVVVDENSSIVRFDSNSDSIPTAINRLKQLGYPVSDAENSILSKATSYVSCMRGRVG